MKGYENVFVNLLDMERVFGAAANPTSSARMQPPSRRRKGHCIDLVRIGSMRAVFRIAWRLPLPQKHGNVHHLTIPIIGASE
jgi:hypothetical protein